MKIAVVIPTYRRAESLFRMLNSLQAQTMADFEILVIDNAADEMLRRKVDEFNRTARIPARYVPEPNLGLHHARHRAAAATIAEILIYTDDDATFAPGTVAAYLDAFTAHPDMAAAGGPVRAVWEQTPPNWLVEFMAGAKDFGILSLMEPHDRFRLEAKGYFYGVNMAIRRERLLAVGGFNPEAFGDTWLGDGESGLNRKLWERGCLIGFVPEAVVYHHIPPERTTTAYFQRRMANEGACAEYARFHRGIPSRPRLVLRFGAILPALAYEWSYAVYRRLFRGDRFFALRAGMSLAYHRVRLRYVARLLHDRELRRLVLKNDWLEETLRTATREAEKNPAAVPPV